MTLTSDYQVFLATANPNLLASDAQLHYVPTLTTFKEPDAIVKHLATQARQLKKKQENLIGAIESSDAVCLEMETTIEFVTSGGAFLPGLDDNMFGSRSVTFPVTHIVRYDSNGKIEQIRQQWDQASLLRSVEVIGARGRNWPIKDGEEQIKLIKRSTADAPLAADELAQKMESASLNTSKSPHPTNDPYATLHSTLYASREERDRDSNTESREQSLPRGSQRPPTRDWDELFPGGNPDQTPTRSRSQSKESVVAPKIGAGKNFAPSRIFDSQSDEPSGAAQEVEGRNMKAHPTKYDHFELFDGHKEAAPPPSVPRPKTKHQSQWDFSDFTTPAKVKQRQHNQSNPSFQIGEQGETPTGKKVAQKPRPSSVANFEMQDDGTRAPDNRPRHARGQGSTVVNHSLYNDHTLDENSKHQADKNDAFKGVKNVSQKDRAKDFAPHFSMDDDPNTTPRGGHGSVVRPTTTNSSLTDRQKTFGSNWKVSDSEAGLGERSGSEMNKAPVNSNRQEAVKTMESSWEHKDHSPANGKGASTETALTGTPGNENKGINIAGDGMGGRKAAVAGGDENKGINIAGDGMGGRKTADSLRSWATGDETPVQKKQGGVRKVFTSSLWGDN